MSSRMPICTSVAAMIDDPAIGHILGPNLTTGTGGRTAGFRPADWDRIVRHGVKPGGVPALMQQQRLQGTTVGSIEDLQAMVSAIAQNKMKPVMLISASGTRKCSQNCL